jgi:hypothetical protein
MKALLLLLVFGLAACGQMTVRSPFYVAPLGQPAAMGPAPFSPTNVGSLALWVAASSGVYADTAKTTPATEGGAVAAWSDLSGRTFDFWQAAGYKQPRFASSLAGHPAVLFGGGNDVCMKTIATNQFTQPVTAFLVVCSSNNHWSEFMDGLGSPGRFTLGNAYDGFGMESEAAALGFDYACAPGAARPITNQWSLTAGCMNGKMSTLWVDGICSTPQPNQLPDFSTNSPVGFTIGQTYGGSWNLFGGIAEMIVYHTNLSAADFASVRDYLRAKYGMAAWPSPQPADLAQPVPMILDTDLAADCDDAGDVALFCKLARLGEVAALAIVTSSTNDYSGETARVIMTNYGLSIPVGTFQGDLPDPNGTGPNHSVFTAQVVTNYGDMTHTNLWYTNSTTVYRQALAGAADRSVVIVGTGFAGALRALLDSGPDGISASTGWALVSNKVARYIPVAGYYVGPNNGFGAEWNVKSDPAAYADVFSRWPGPIVACGIELNNTFWDAKDRGIFTGPPAPGGNTNCPQHLAYQLFTGGAARPAWGQLGVLYGARGTGSGLVAYGINGSNYVNETSGTNLWTATPGNNCSYLRKTMSDTNLIETLNGLLNAEP